MKRILAIVAFLLLFGTIGHASLIVPNEPQPGQRYRLSASGIDPDFPFEATGLSAREAEHCWSDGKKVTFTIPFAKNVRAFVFENVTALGAQTVGVYVNDGFLKGYMFNNDTPVQNMVVVLRKDLRSPAVVEFRIPQACRPSKFFPDNTDPRELGLTFRTVALSGQLLKDKQQYTETDCQHWISRLEFMSKDITSIFGAGGFITTFPGMIARTLKDEIDALEQAIHEFATAKNCAVSDIWVDEKNALSRIRNKAVIGLATAQLMENMTSEWRADDKKSAKPLVIGAAINQMFVDRDDATVALDNCPQGLLLTEYENLIQEAREQAKQLRHQTLIQLSQTDGLKKQYALELLDLDILIQAENEKLNQGRPIDFKGLRENQNLFSRRLDQLKTLGVTLKSDQDILNELCAVRLPIYTKMELVASLLFRL